MKRILVPVDFSAHTSISCQLAVLMADRTGSEVILFHSFLNQVFYTDGGLATGFESGIMLTDDIILDFFKQKEKALAALEKEVKSFAEEKGLNPMKISSMIESGDPEVQITHAINSLAPDLVVMGSAGIGRKGLFAGSVARRIMLHSDVPVIAVPELAEAKDLSIIAYMTGFDPGDVQAILKINSLFPVSVKEIHLAHLLRDNDSQQAADKLAQIAETPELSLIRSKLQHHLIKTENINQALGNFVRDNGISMLAFIPHKRNVLQNLLYQGITRQDLYQTNLALMAIPISPVSS